MERSFVWYQWREEEKRVKQVAMASKQIDDCEQIFTKVSSIKKNSIFSTKNIETSFKYMYLHIWRHMYEISNNS